MMRSTRQSFLQTPRPTCYHCFRPRSHCVCLSESFEAHTDLLILQHPHERRKYHSSTKIVVQGIRNAELIRGIVLPEDEISARIGERSPYLLYPGADAVDCRDVALDRSNVVIVVDGTWHEARKLVHRNPFLKTLPKVSFSSPLRSEYRIRKQPQAHCLSTLESIVHLLLLSPGDSTDRQRKHYRGLLEAFRAMIQRQLDATQNVPRRPQRRASRGLVANKSPLRP